MRKTSAGFVLLAASLGIGLAQSASQPAGHWNGKIQIPEHELGITVDLAKGARGEWIGSMSVIGTTSLDVPLAAIAVDGAVVRFAANFPERAGFEGRLSEDGNSLSGTASNTQGGAPFRLDRSGEANVKVPPPSSVLSKEFAGAWEGSLDAGGKTMRVALKMSASPNGIATAILSVVEQGNMEIPVTTVTIEGKALQLEARAVSGTYRGTLDGGGNIVGEWAQGPNRVPLTFKPGKP